MYATYFDKLKVLRQDEIATWLIFSEFCHCVQLLRTGVYSIWDHVRVEPRCGRSHCPVWWLVRTRWGKQEGFVSCEVADSLERPSPPLSRGFFRVSVMSSIFFRPYHVVDRFSGLTVKQGTLAHQYIYKQGRRTPKYRLWKYLLVEYWGLLVHCRPPSETEMNWVITSNVLSDLVSILQLSVWVGI